MCFQIWSPRHNRCLAVVRVFSERGGVRSVAHRNGSSEIHQWIAGRPSGLHVLQSKYSFINANINIFRHVLTTCYTDQHISDVI